jgi:hypothetical protein
MAQNKKTYPKGHPLYELPKSPSVSSEKQLETVKNSGDSGSESGDRVRLNLSISCKTDEIFSAAADCLGVTKTALVTSLLMQSLPVLRAQVEAVRAIK